MKRNQRRRIKFHASLTDELGDKFGVDLTAGNREEAFSKLKWSYPESIVRQLESQYDRQKRRAVPYRRVHQSNWAIALA